MRIFAKEEFRPTGGVPANRTATVSPTLRTSSARHATAGRHTRRTARHAQTLLGLRQLPSRAGGDHPLRLPGARHAGADAHRRRQVAHLSGADNAARRFVHRRNAADRPDEGPGRPPQAARHQRGGDPFGTFDAANRHRARQLRLRRCQIPLRGSRTARDRGVPSARGADAGLAAGRRRGALHLAVGLRLPPLLPAHRRTARTAARSAGAGAHGIGHTRCRPRHHAAAALRRTARPAQLVRTAQPLLRRAARRGQKRATASRGAQRGRQRYRLRAHARRLRTAHRIPARRRRRRDLLPRRPGQRRTLDPAGGVARGPHAHHGGHQRLRHGNRQGRRAFRRPLLHARLARKLLSGSGPCGTRRKARLCRAARRPGRRRARAAPLRPAIPAARRDPRHLRKGLLLPANRHRRRRAGVVRLQHPRLLREVPPLRRQGRQRAETVAAERLSDAHRRNAQPRAHSLLHQPRRPLQTARGTQ